jgi:Wiskott-Aldrich syndrome protein
MLSYEQVDRLKSVLGDTASPLSHTIARLLLATPNQHTWNNTKLAGALVLVIDRKRECKLIRLYDINTWQVLFDEELYVGSKYEAPLPYFHTFEIPNGYAGLDFPVEQQAEQFWTKVQQMIPKHATAPSLVSVQPASNQSTRKGLGLLNFFGFEDNSAQEKPSIISKPSNVQHLQHIGYDPEKGFQIENIPEDWKKVFKSAGIKAKDLANPETAQLIMKTIDQYAEANPESNLGAPDSTDNGGEDDYQAPPTAPPPVPTRRGAPAAPPSGRAPPPAGRAPPPSGRAPPPAGRAPPAARPPAPPAPGNTAGDKRASSVSASAPPAIPNAPPPPVPPPAAPVPPPVAGRAISSERSNLLADIRKGAALKKVEVDDRSNPGSTNAPVAGKGKGGGGDLADQLRIIMAQRRVQTKAEQVEDDEDDDW